VETRQLFDLDGKVAIVTGGGRGIGRDLAIALAEMGAHVVVCGRNQETCDETAAELAGRGVRALGIRCDVRSPEDVAEVVRRTIAELARVDILVNNAGATWAAAPEELSLEAWQKVVDVNLTGVFLFCQAAGREMISQRSGRVINISSVAAFRSAPPELMNALPYQTTKAGVVSLTRDLACKWASHGINVNSIAPGWFPTDMSRVLLAEHEQAMLERIPLGRFGEPDDLKGTLVLLASRAGAWITGQTFIVDGGQSAW
jgi:NAD(P)-dependent dehydrogenase (short-subunit alcohol dehydrogenase family)